MREALNLSQAHTPFTKLAIGAGRPCESETPETDSQGYCILHTKAIFVNRDVMFQYLGTKDLYYYLRDEKYYPQLFV